MRSILLRGCLACCVALLGGPPARSGAVAGTVRPDTDKDDVEVPPKIKEAIEKGLAYLASQQRPDGSWTDYRYGGAMAINSFAALALMAGGHTPGRGRYGQHVARSLRYHLSAVQPSGLIEHGIPHYAMYSHGMATLCLAEMYGASKNDEVRTALKKATELIIRCQNNQGGWRYQPRVYDADISVTVMQVTALRAARNCGLHVPSETIDHAIRYVKGCRVAKGGFSYQYGSGPPGFARTAAGCMSLLMAGEYEAPEVVQGLAYLKANRRTAERAHYWYGQYYAAQAMYQAGGEYWRDWYPFICDELMRRADPRGFWRDQAGGAPTNNIFETSIALLVLQIPYHYLPIFQR